MHARLQFSNLLALALMSLAATGCSVIGQDSDEPAQESPTSVVLVTHESFVLPDELKAKFEQDSGLTLVVRASGDAGTLTNKLVLTQGNPTGDVAFGVDNTFASRALDADVFTTYDGELPAGAEKFRLEGDDTLAPIDQANVCVNVDTPWFRGNELAPPTTLEDLTDPAYADLFVLPGAATSSPGMAFLLSTIAEYGDDWPDYWSRLMDNGAKLTAGWSDAYYVDFTQGGEGGERPIVLSYDSSPAFTLTEGTAPGSASDSNSAALLQTCFQQVEYAGVLAGADNPEGGAKTDRLPALRGGAGRTSGRDVRLPGPRGCRTPRGLGEVRRATDRPLRGGPGRDRGQSRRLVGAVDRGHDPVRHHP